MGLWGAGVPRGSKKNFKHGHMAYQINGDDEQTRMQVKFSSLGQTGDLGVRSKGQILINFKDFYTKLCLCSHKCKIQHISDRIFILSPGSCPRGGLWGAGGAQGVKKNIFSKHGHVAYQIDGDDEQNRSQVKFSS